MSEQDNRGSHYYVALYWARALAASDNAALKAQFAPIAKALGDAEDAINSELLAVQGPAQELGGYYLLDDDVTTKAMRPSATLNAIIDGITA